MSDIPKPDITRCLPILDFELLHINKLYIAHTASRFFIPRHRRKTKMRLQKDEGFESLEETEILRRLNCQEDSANEPHSFWWWFSGAK